MLCGNSFADEVITDFDAKSVPVLNEELREIRGKLPKQNTQTKTLLWYVGGDLEVETNASARIDVPFSGTIIEATAQIKTAPTGASVIIDINKNGTTLWASGKLTITATSTSGSKTTFDAVSVNEDDYFTLDIDQIGSTLPGSDLTVQLMIDVSL